ncbi:MULTISPECIES: hypothetical protein, partial [Escherichia]
VFKGGVLGGAIEIVCFMTKTTGNYQVLDCNFNGKGPCAPFPFYRLLKTSFIFVERIYLTGLIICSLSELKWL